jgi:transposase InsO family protein
MGRNHLAALGDCQVEALDAPLRLAAFAPGLPAVVADRCVRARLLLGTRYAPVLTPPERVFVVDCDMDAVLLGRPLLTALDLLPEARLEGIGHANALAFATTEPPVGGGVVEAGATDAEQVPENVEDPFVGAPEISRVVDDSLEVETAREVDEMLRRAQAAAGELGPELWKELTAAVRRADCWRVAMKGDPPAHVAPYEPVLKPGVRPVKARARAYGRLQEAALREEMAAMEAAGLVYEDPSSTWGSAALVLPKAGGGWRVVVDLRAVNKCLEPVALQLPEHRDQQRRLAGSRFFGKVDLLKGFWQIPVSEAAQSIFSIVTPFGVFAVRRMMMGIVDASAVFQQRLTDTLKGLVARGVEIWVDDVLVHAPTAGEFVARMVQVLRCLDQAGWKIHPRKVELVATSVVWCGRLYSERGVEVDPSRVQALRDVASPATLADLGQWLGAVGWIRAHLPKYAECVYSLTAFYDQQLAALQRRTKKAAAKVSLADVGWTAELEAAFQGTKELIVQAATLAHPDPAKQVKLFTDASDKAWAAVIVQVDPRHADAPLHEQQMEPLQFLSGRFSGSSLNWSMIDKEAFALYQAAVKCPDLLLVDGGFVFSGDNRTVVYIFDPAAVVPEARHATVARVYRWAMYLSMFRYVCEHIPGEENVFADLLTRWAVSPARGASDALRVAAAVRALRGAAAAASGSDGMGEVSAAVDWRVVRASDGRLAFPSEDVLREAQREACALAATMAGGVDAGLVDGLEVQVDEATGLIVEKGSRRIWVPDIRNLRERICLLAHGGFSGHRGARVTIDRIKQLFTWRGVGADAKRFVQSCLHCRTAKGPAHHVRPLGEAIRGVRRGQVLHFDFLFLGPSREGVEYVLPLMDGFTGYVNLVPCSAADAHEAAKAVLAWVGRYGVPEVLVSDQGPHFKNQLVAILVERLGVVQHFTCAYAPWANGHAERLNRVVLAAFRAILQELRLPPDDWTCIVDVVASSINHAPSASRGGVAPMQSFLGMETNPLAVAMASKKTAEEAGDSAIVAVDPVLVERSTRELREELEQFHAAVRGAEEQRTAEREAVNAARRAHPEFIPGDYVLVTEVSKLRWKLQAVKSGPFLVVRPVSPWVYRVQHVLTGQEREVHAERLEFYADRSLLLTEELKEHVRYQASTYEVQRIVDVRRSAAETPSGWEVKLRWWGFSAAEDTWEDVMVCVECCPALLERFLASRKAPKGFRLAAEHLLRK